MVCYLILLVGHIGIALVQDIAITYGLANELRELCHISKHTDIKLLVASHRLRCKGEHFYQRTRRLIYAIENALITVWEIAAINKRVKGA